MAIIRIFYVLLYILYITLSSTVCDSSVESSTSKPNIFPKAKCESLLQNCSCYDFDGVEGIFCSTVSNFKEFSTLLANGSIFEENSTYEISIAGVKSLPPRFIEGLIVFRLFLDDYGISEIENGAFDGILRLRRFHVRRSSVKELPDFRKIRNSLRNLHFENSRLTTLEGQFLQGLPLLAVISFTNNSISRIEPGVFKGTDNVWLFDISYNKLTTIPEHLLDNWKKLQKIVLTHNNLYHVGDLFLSIHPKFISLDYNNLTDADSILHPGMHAVESLNLAGNPIVKITPNSFNGKIPSIRFLYLDHCRIREFDVGHYKGLIHLNNLDLSWNLIEKIPGQSLDFGTTVELDLMYNQIREFQGEMTYRMKRIYLQGNKLESLGKTFQLSQLQEVSVADNILQFLSVEDFRGVHNMANVELQRNQIQWIDRYTFRTIRNDLNYLDLSMNLIRSLNGSMRYLSQLKSLNLTGNLLQTFEYGEFTGLNELSELYLQHNRIIALNNQLQQIPQLQFMIISHNHIRTIYKEQIPPKLRFLYLKDNPISCDCKLLPFLQWLNSSDGSSTDEFPCARPAAGKGVFVFRDTRCPDPCSCSCETDALESFMSMDCSSQNMSVLPYFLTQNVMLSEQNYSAPGILSWNPLEFDQSTDDPFLVRDQIRCINLENNTFESIDSIRPPPDLRHLYLANNQLRKLPQTIMYSLPQLKKISLSSNPWDCNCQAIELKKWILSNRDIVKDINETRCKYDSSDENDLDGRLIWMLTDLDLCPPDAGMIIMISMGVLIFLLFCAATKILYTRYEMKIKVYLYSHGVTWVKEKDIDKDKIYDVFVSFSAKDKTFVLRSLLPVIKSKYPEERICIHYKDFDAGDYITNNIAKAIENSKRTLIVLTTNFLESEWCLTEFEYAHNKTLTDKVPRLIVMKVGELTKVIHPTVKKYLESVTYLIWGERYFWENLLYHLPTPTPTAHRLPQQDMKRALLRKFKESSSTEHIMPVNQTEFGYVSDDQV